MYVVWTERWVDVVFRADRRQVLAVQLGEGVERMCHLTGKRMEREGPLALYVTELRPEVENNEALGVFSSGQSRGTAATGIYQMLLAWIQPR